MFHTLAAVLCLAALVNSASSCGPLRGGGRRRPPRKLTPLVFKQHVPNVNEFTLGASGQSEGKLTRDHPKFKSVLVPNYNSDIIFRDEEGTGADRLMTQRCKEKLNTLAILVMNQYPGVKLRVTEGFDEESYHSTQSLHYEGRAVDVTTSDRDRSKYGMLARLAVEAGFDFVYYESRSHIHCSVKSESADAGRSGGCFDGDSTVRTEAGPKKMSDLQVGERVQVARTDGQTDYSEVILFLDRNETQQRLYNTLETENGRSITLTPTHLIFTASPHQTTPQATFAKHVEIGDYIYVASDRKVTLEKVISVTSSAKKGVFAPLTREGNLVVDGVVASCYAIIEDQALAHFAFAPVRLIDNVWEATLHLLRTMHILRYRESRTIPPHNGIHWYANFLYSIAHKLIPED
ncbi:sonic hedgehog protein-like precursor [Parasteatoda tepidariorum]|uniref:Hedgehog protein n=1 Tax=Parasteatoda tepidariorum TaxID=114398 RepID=Q75UQ8_PARTP|nr:sonic hedgehog protein-like precursor [Parasteatoda tepidariorum]BAD01490.1 hedgehog [Parasteatoda tepidariorum]